MKLLSCALMHLTLVNIMQSIAMAVDCVVTIPGAILKNPIYFSEIVPTHSVQGRVTSRGAPDNGKGADLSRFLERYEGVDGISLPMPTPAGQDNFAWFPIENPQAVATIGTPIPLAIEFTTPNAPGEGLAKMGKILPDCLRAWNRLQNWNSFKNAVSQSKVEDVNKLSIKLSESITYIIRNGSLSQEHQQRINTQYRNLSEHLIGMQGLLSGSVREQLTYLIRGVRAERLAWESLDSIEYPILNPFYTDPGSNPPELVQKSVPRVLSNTYSGFQELQVLRDAINYKRLYQQSRAFVGITQDGGDVFATGTIIGRNLILTCAHSVSRAGKNGSPPADPDTLEIVVGNDFPRDNLTPQENIKAQILYEGTVSDGYSSPLDFTLLYADVESYEKKYLAQAETYRDGIKAQEASKPESLRNPVEAARRMIERGFFPINPIPLTRFQPSAKDQFTIVGFPNGKSKKISSNGKIIFPFAIDTFDFKELRATLLAMENLKLQEIQLVFDNIYQKNPALNLYTYRYGQNGSPGIGAICATTAGNSGSAAILKGRAGPAGSIIGIVTEGQPARAISWTPSILRHEIILPIHCILDQLDAKFKKNHLNQDFESLNVKWSVFYKVTISG